MRYILIIKFVFLATLALSQGITKVSGIIIDGETREMLPFVNVSFKGTSVGTTTDMNGYYQLETRFPSDSLMVSFIGYKEKAAFIVKEESQEVNFKLFESSIELETVEFVVKKQKYSKKNNPAIDLSQKVIENSYKNSLKSLPFYSYNQQEKIRLDINNITEDFKEARFVRKFDFMWDFIDTSDVNGRTFLPFFMKENLSTIYYKKEGKDKKEVVNARRSTKFDQGVDPQSVDDIMNALYQDIDIYEGQISLLENQFVSPFHPSGKDFYRYYILDTTEVNNRRAIKLAFIPAIKGNLGFNGNVFISDDGDFTVLKVDMGVVDDINLNFVRDIHIIQEFDEIEGNYVKIKDEIVVDYALSSNSIGLYGTRSLFFKNYNFDKPEDMSVFSSGENIVTAADSEEKSDEFWIENRIIPLEIKEKELYKMIGQLTEDKYYKRYSYFGKVVTTGYLPLGPVSLGVIATFLSFNEVEGLNIRVGGETNNDFSDKVQLEGSLARAFKTEEWKYSAGLTYTFNEAYNVNPRHYIRASIERNSEFPGQELDFYSPGNFFLSFQRGDATKMLLSESYNVLYHRELPGVTYGLGLTHKKRQAYGSLDFKKYNEGVEEYIDDISTSEVALSVRYAPNEQFIQGKDRRTQIFNEYPIVRVNYIQGLKDVLGGDYSYSKLKINLFKQFEWTLAGTTNVDVEGGQTFGDIPYLLQFVPRGNQTYAYELNSYNLMNFLEFSADRYVSMKVEHYFSGLLFNRLPLIKHLKLREIVTIKGIYGDLSKDKDPRFNPDQIQFPTDVDGNPTTFTFDNRPYFEASFGITNIFKVLRVDIVYRPTYHEHPNVPALFGEKGLGLRVKTHVEF